MKCSRPCRRWPLERQALLVYNGPRPDGIRPQHAWRRQRHAIRSTTDLARQQRGGDTTSCLKLCVSAWRNLPRHLGRENLAARERARLGLCGKRNSAHSRENCAGVSTSFTATRLSISRRARSMSLKTLMLPLIKGWLCASAPHLRLPRVRGD